MAVRRSTRLSSIGLSESQDSVGYFNTRYSLNTFLKKVKKLSGAQKKAIQSTGFGNFLEIPNQTLNKTLLVELMRRWDVGKQSVVLPCGELHLTLMDVALILGLRVTGTDVHLDDNEPFFDLEGEYGGSVWKRNVTVASLESRLDSFGEICNDDFIRSFLLYAFGTFFFPNANDKVDTRYLTFLKNVDHIGSYAWGKAVLEHLTKWLDKRKDMDVKYVGGCLLFLQIWAFEHIDVARPPLLHSFVAFPRVFRWDNAKSHTREPLSSKFKDLEHHQVTWVLQPTSWDLEVDIIKELLETQSNGTKPCEADNSSIDFPINADIALGATRQLMSQEVVQVDTEPKTSPVNARQCEREVDLNSPTQDISKGLTDLILCSSTPIFLSKQQKQPNLDVNLGTTRQLVNQEVILVETESETSPAVDRQCGQEVNLNTPTQDISEVLIDVIPSCSTPILLSKQLKPQNWVAESNNSNSTLKDDEEDLRTRFRISQHRIMELEEENHKLRMENELLKSQQSSGSLLEEDNRLKREMDDLRRENEALNNLMVRVGKILFDENADFAVESHPIPTQE